MKRRKSIKIGSIYRVIKHQSNDSTTSLLIGLSVKITKKFRTTRQLKSVLLYEGEVTSEGNYQETYHEFLIDELDEYNTNQE